MTRSTRRAPAADADPLGQAVITDSLGLIPDLTDFLGELSAYDQSGIKALLFKKPPGMPGALGKFEFIETVPAPIELAAVMDSLKTRFGGGDYRITVFAGGKTRKQIEVSIMGEAKTPAAPAPAETAATGTDRLMMMMMQMQEQGRAQMLDQQRYMADQQRQRDESMWKAAALIVPVVAPLMFAGREKLTDVLALMQANKPEASNLKDTVETFTLMKALFEPGDKGGGEFNPDDVVGSISRMAGPMLAAAGRAFGSARNGGAAGELADNPAPAGQVGDGRLHLPAPDPQPVTPPASTAPGSPVINLIRPHVLYFFSAHLEPGLAAEAITDIMTRAGVTEDDLNGLVTAFTFADDWKSDLAAQGIDLRSDPQWADDFLAEIVSQWTSVERGADGSAGGGGGLADAEDHADPGAPGLAVNGHSRPGASA